MLKKTIKFRDLDGNEITEDFYFNLSRAEIIELELSKKDGLSEYLQQLIKTENGGEIIAAMKDIIKMSIGRRSEDGRRFIKSQEITDDFIQTEAYTELFMELATQADAAADFVRGIMPSDAELELARKTVTDVNLPDEQKQLPAWVTENRVPTEAELVGASPELLMEAFRRKNVSQQN